MCEAVQCIKGKAGPAAAGGGWSSSTTIALLLPAIASFGEHQLQVPVCRLRQHLQCAAAAGALPVVGTAPVTVATIIAVSKTAS